MAYNNIIAPIDPESNNNTFINVRKSNIKSRNNNYSLTDNRGDGNTSASNFNSFNNQNFSEMHRSSLNANI